MRRPRLLPLLALVALLPPLTAGATAAAAAPPGGAATTPDPGYLPELLARARAARLGEDRAWLALGHFRRRWIGGYKGEADGPRFYLAPGGQLDPTAELEATLRALFSPGPRADELDDALCRFPARAAFLRRRLAIDPARLPARPCPRLEAFRARVAARAVTVVFSAYYLDNPASSFGHTFLRLDQRDAPLPGKTFELLDYGVDYAARPDTGNAFLYAFKGLLGLFHGTFNHYPFYYKVREYEDDESRDLWEYDLALAPDEVALLVDHLWELGGTWFDYWYLDENCSYHVLGALEAAAPRLDLLSRVEGPIVLPADTVKALFRNPGLVRAIHYRPSLRTQLDARLARLDARDRAAVREIAAAPAAPLPAGDGPAERAAVLDAAADLVDLRHGHDIALERDPAASEARQALLGRRAEIPVQSPELDLSLPEAKRPELGHGALRLGLGGGASTQDGGFAALDFRLCLHDLADPPDGYPDGAAIEFLPARLRWASRPGRLELDDGSLVRIVSLSPVTAFDQRASWHLRVGATTVRDGGCDRCLAGAVGGGAGLDLGLAGGALDAAAFGDAELLASPRLSGAGGSGWRPGVGPSGLVRLRLGEEAALLAGGEWRWLPDARPGSTWGVDGTLRLHVLRRVSIGLEARARPEERSASLVVFLFDGR